MGKCVGSIRIHASTHSRIHILLWFEQWKKDGVYADYLVLFSSFVNSGLTAPDMLVRLDFAKYADSAKWKLIERSTPAGMSAAALALCTPVTSYLADLNYFGKPSDDAIHASPAPI